MNSIKIDKEVYEKGRSLGLFSILTRDQAEMFCKNRTQETGFKYDFFYEGSKINIMTLNPNHSKID